VAIAAVQRKGKGSSTTSQSIGAGDGWATPTAGNLLVVSANGDFTTNAPSGSGTWTAGPSTIDGNGVYTYYKVSDGTESTITVSLTSGTFHFCITACEYSGLSAAPFDTSNSSTVSGTGGTSTTAVSVTTTAAADLVVAFALLHGAGASVPTGPSWSNSFVNGLSADSSTSGVTNQACYTFIGELMPAGAAGAYSTAASWTNSATDRQEIVLAFLAGASPTYVRRPAPRPRQAVAQRFLGW
jgi:hypothetical protein